MEMVVVKPEALVGVILEAPSDSNLLLPLVGVEPAILSAEPALLPQLASDRHQQPALVAAVVVASSPPTNLPPADSLVDSQARAPLVDYSEQHRKVQGLALVAQGPALARRQLQILSAPLRHKTNRASLVAPVLRLGAAQLEVACSLVLARLDSGQTRRRKDQTPLVLSARKISRASKAKIKTKQAASLAAEGLERRKRHKPNLLVAYSVEPSLPLVVVVDSSAAARPGKVCPRSEELARALVEASLVERAHNNKSQVCLVEAAALEAHKIRTLADCSVTVARLRNKEVAFSEGPLQTIPVVSLITPSSNRSRAFSEPTSPTQHLRTTVFLVGSRAVVCSTLHNRVNRHLNNINLFILLSWMAILTANRPSGLGFLKLPRKTLDRLSRPFRPVSA